MRQPFVFNNAMKIRSVPMPDDLDQKVFDAKGKQSFSSWAREAFEQHIANGNAGLHEPAAYADSEKAK